MPPPPERRLSLLEGPERDFPFYNGVPTAIAHWQWALVLLLLAAGFAALIAPIPALTAHFGQLVPALLFVALPLVALARVAPGHLGALFGRVGARELGWMAFFAVLALLSSIGMALLVGSVFEVADNPMARQMGTLSPTDMALFFLKTIPQLVGEELLTMLPFLAVLSVAHRTLGVPRRQAVLWAGLISTLLFSAAHLPTYDWNVAQCFLVIGTARLLLTLSYVRTKNLWVSAGAHMLMDWTALGATWAATRLGGAA